MKRVVSLLALLLAASLWPAVPARADEGFGLKNLDLTFLGADGAPQMQAGSHPFAIANNIDFNTMPDPKLGEVPIDAAHDILVELPEGLVGAPGAVPRCSGADFANAPKGEPSCADSTAVGRATVEIGIGTNGGQNLFTFPVYNLEPPPAAVQNLGFNVAGVPVTIAFTVESHPPYKILASVTVVSQAVRFYRSQLTVWGNPADPLHDPFRGKCSRSDGGSSGNCPAAIPERPFVTSPRACLGPLPTTFRADSWQDPGAFFEQTIFTHDHAEPPNPTGFSGCAKLAFNPSISAQPTSKASSSPSGLDFGLAVHDEGLTNPTGLAQSDIRKAVVTLPEGMSANPSLAEGLAVCTEDDLAREAASSAPGVGCPNASKIGTVAVETPLLEDDVSGALFIAKPYANPFGSLLALYMVIKNPMLGILITQPLKVEPDPVTGQLTTVAEELPQLPFSHFRLHFREGVRSPLATPGACGNHTVKAELYPSSGSPPVTSTSTFQIISGPNSSPCPAGGLPSLHPQLLAGTVSNAAGHFSPFNVKITRTDAEQEITHFSIKLPPGVAGKLAGIPLCADAQIAQASSRTGPHGGQEELDDPSCPAASQVGRSLAGAGIGPSLAYAPGKIYLAGPYHGAPISLVAITAGIVGPFDIGTVVVRLAVKVNPETGQVFLDSTGSDPIPHIIKGIPVHLRDIRAYTDRPEFTFNPTSCEPTSTASTVLGGGLDFVSAADDNPFVATSRFQAADCAALPFNPKLTFKTVGSTKRGGNPSLRAHVAMKGIGEAAIGYAQVTLPKSEFLDNAHIGTVCTRVQFREGAVPGEKCPAVSVYGRISATTPILDGPLTGPIYLRSSEHELPDLVAALHHEQINVTLVGRVDSVKGGGIRNTFELVPDAPVTSADFTFFGSKKGLLENSRNLCTSTNKIKVLLKAHSGKRLQYETPLKPTGCKKSKRKHKRHAQRP
jgi:hypothetical protein